MDEKVKDRNEAQIFTLSAVVVGFLLLQELDLNEQNDLGNWFLLLGQLLCTNAARLSVLQTIDNSNNMANETMSGMLEKTVKAMQQEIEELKQNVNKTT